ncbi:hypothetical protein F4861DRAFT_117814 [Xylaria intraflava]|nr:hypothetical protein F4861DRAFT_117814 [Xylaria intraflava]
MTTRVFQSARFLSRRGQRAIVGSCIGLSIGTGVAMQASPRIRFDGPAASPSAATHALAPIPSPAASPRGRKDQGPLSPELMRQLSGGSVTGFLSGLLVSVFSRTLVLILGVSVVIVQVAAEYGIDIVDQLRLKERVGTSRVLAALEREPAFKLSFGLFFALSAFMHF